MTYKYILFDLDGTLTDPKEGITKAVQYALKKQGVEIENRDLLEPFIGPPLKSSFMAFYNFTEGQAIQAIEDYRVYFREVGIFENEVYSGINKLLSKLKDKGIELFIATSKPTEFAVKIAKHFDFDKYFTEIVGSELDGTRVEKDEVIEYILDKYALHEEDEVMMIGDRKFDVLGAAKHEIRAIGVCYGYGSYEELSEAGAFCIVDTVEALSTYLLED